MRYNIKSFISSNKRVHYLIALALVLVVVVFVSEYSRSNSNNTAIQDVSASDEKLKWLLAKSENQVGFSGDSAEFFAGKLLALAAAQNKTKYLVRALLVFGNIKKFKGEYTVAYNFYKRATVLGHEKHLVEEECTGILNIGEIIYKRGDYNSATQQFLRADSLAKSNNLESLESQALYFLGKCNQTKGNFQQAKFFYLRSLALARKNKDEKQLALLLPSLGKYFITEGKLVDALSCYQEAFYISTRLKDQFMSADICNHLGGLFLELKEYKKAMDYHRKALQYRLELNYPGELAKSYNNIGKIYLRLNELDSAEYYFTSSLKLCNETGYKKGKVKALTNLGEVFRISGRLTVASDYLFEAFENAKSIGYDNGIAESSLSIGELFRIKKDTENAISYYKIALDKFIKTNYYEDLLKVYNGLYSSYLLRLDYKNALIYHESILEVEKKLLDVENKRQLAIVNISFDTERKEHDFKVLQKDNELKASMIRSKNAFIWLIVSVLSFTILLCLYVYNRFYIKKRANKKLEEFNKMITLQNIELKKLNTEIEEVSKEKDKLFTIISHELRNPLYWLQNLAEVLSKKHNSMPADKIKKTLMSMDESAKNVYHLMDNLLYWSRSKLNRVLPKKSQHNLNDLILATTSMYESFFKQKEITYIPDIPTNIYIYVDADLFACVIRNLISNAIKYTANGGWINFNCEKSSDFVTLTISDSGKGMAESHVKTLFEFTEEISVPGLSQEKGSGLGLRLCKDFVELNAGKIWAESTQGEGTRFFFTVPIQQADQLNTVKSDALHSVI
jgi:signal transduction histidine kinase/Tfp pilus assembly protein PilF